VRIACSQTLNFTEDEPALMTPITSLAKHNPPSDLPFEANKMHLPLRRCQVMPPLIVDGIRRIDAFGKRIAAAIELLVLERVTSVRTAQPQRQHAVDDICRQGEPINLVQDGEFHGRVDVALLL
jgi:hypothetical protein